MRPTTDESRDALMRAVGVPRDPLPQSIDRPPPSEARVFMARVVLGCIGLALLLLFVYGVVQLATQGRPT